MDGTTRRSALLSLLAATACQTDRQTNDGMDQKPPSSYYIEECLARDETCETCRREHCDFDCCNHHDCVVALSKTSECLRHHWNVGNGECWFHVDQYDEPMLACLMNKCVKDCFPGPDPNDLPPSKLPL